MAVLTPAAARNKNGNAQAAAPAFRLQQRLVKAAPADANYVIGPQDMLDISVWKEEQLTKTVPVRPDGKISMPLLNDVQAAGLTPTQLANQITESLKKFVTDPQVTVIVREINSQRVYLLGEVTRAARILFCPT